MSPALESWRRCIRIHQRYVNDADRIHEAIGNHAMVENDEYQRVRRSLKKLLSNFSYQIEHSGRASYMKQIRDKMDGQLQTLHSLLAAAPELQHIIVSDQPAQEDYYAVLVTTPPKHGYGPFVDRFCAVPDIPPAIDWDSRNTLALPSMLDSLVFRRHFALCLVKRGTWESADLPLRSKFQDQRFWNYYGVDRSCSKGETWNPIKISAINAIHVLGIIDSAGDAVSDCSNYHEQLRVGWRYRNIWWNDADFALCLSGLMVGDLAATICSNLYRRLEHLRRTTIEMARVRMGGNNFMIGWCGCVTMGIVTAVTMGASAPLTGPGLFGFWAYGIGSGIATSATEAAGNFRRDERIAAQARLRRAYPALQNIFD